jgi:hypothetical protein
VREKEREDITLRRNIPLRSCGKLAAIPTGNDTALNNFIGCKLFCIEEAGLVGCYAVWLGK